MSQRNKNNSIIFLTTLSVYLGLVLVGGGTPSVLAQAALTQKITEVQSEANNESDDKDCWDDASREVLDLLNADFQSDEVLDFVRDIQKLIAIEKYELSDDFNFEFKRKSTETGIGQTSYLENSGNGWIKLAASDLVERFASNSYYRYDEEFDTKTSHSTVQFSVKSGELTIKSSKEKESNKSAEGFAKLYNNAFEVGKCSKYVEENSKVVYQNSKALSENNQVIIITRLPRGSLDALLKQDAKAENQ